MRFIAIVAVVLMGALVLGACAKKAGEPVAPQTFKGQVPVPPGMEESKAAGGPGLNVTPPETPVAPTPAPSGAPGVGKPSPVAPPAPGAPGAPGMPGKGGPSTPMKPPMGGGG